MREKEGKLEAESWKKKGKRKEEKKKEGEIFQLNGPKSFIRNNEEIIKKKVK